jgi:hypothetical protein
MTPEDVSELHAMLAEVHQTALAVMNGGEEFCHEVDGDLRDIEKLPWAHQ